MTMDYNRVLELAKKGKLSEVIPDIIHFATETKLNIGKNNDRKYTF